MNEQQKFEVVSAKVDVLEEKVKELRKRVDSFDNIKEVLVELKILSSQQIEANAQRDEMLQEHGVALAKAIDTLKEIGKKVEKQDNSIEELKNRGVLSMDEIIKYVLSVGAGILATALFTGLIK